MVKTILLLDDIHNSVISYIQNRGYDVVSIPEASKESILEVVENVHCIIYRLFTTTMDREVIEKAKNLKCIVRTGGGAGAIDFQSTNDRGIKIMHTQGCNSFSAAEFIFAAFMNMSRKISLGNQYFKSGEFDRSKLWGSEMADKTVGIVGFGRMGKFLSKMAQGFDMKVIAFSPNISYEEKKQFNIKSVSLDDLYKQSDFISITFPPQLEDKDMFNKDAFEKMKPGVMIVNATWMGLFNTDDLVEAINSNIVVSVTFDRPNFDPSNSENPFLNIPEVIFSPTLGSHTHEGQSKCGIAAVDIAIDYLENNKITNEVVVGS